MINKKYILSTGLLAITLATTGCSSSVAKLAVDTKEITTIDATAKFDPKDYLKDVAEGAYIGYGTKDNVMTITVSKDDKTETFEFPVEIQEPNVSIDDDITIDTYVGYDIEDYIHEDEGVTHTTNFNEETGELSVTFSKGEWTTILDSNVKVTSSEPEEVWPKYYHCLQKETDVTYDFTLNKDGSFANIANGDYSDLSYGAYTYDGDNSWYFDFYGYNDLTGSGDYDNLTINIPRGSGSGYLYSYCTPVERDSVN